MNFVLSVAGSRDAKYWARKVYSAEEFIEILENPTITPEPFSEYIKLPRADQDALKDVGGFIGATLKNGRRKKNDVLARTALTLDFDHVPADMTFEDIERRAAGIGAEVIIYPTRKSQPHKLRFRAVVPLSRPVTVEEYEPIARRISAVIGIDMADPTTYDANRLFYWPSLSADMAAHYHVGHIDGPALNGDAVLREYDDWRNVAEWPVGEGEHTRIVRGIKQQDPLTKSGVVGAFCKAFTVTAAVLEYIPEIYSDEGYPGRLTYTGGSTANGAVLYEDDRFIYSHHATDPAGGELMNAFDLIRVHRFRDEDDRVRPGTPTNKRPSYEKMRELAMQNTEVRRILIDERYDEAGAAFTDPDEPETEEGESWRTKLTLNKDGKAAKTTENIRIILENDPGLAGRLHLDEFSGSELVTAPLKWDRDRTEQERRWTDTDDASLRCYLESAFGIAGKDKIMDATQVCFKAHAVNKVRDYLEALQWDGIPRVDTLLVDYFGVTDNAYTRESTRRMLTGAVMRVFRPGGKYDEMMIIIGPQGTLKSTFLAKLGGEWYSDSLYTFEGKDAAELIQGNWIIEVPELAGMNKSELNDVKQFLSKTDDKYRAAYARRVKSEPRRCVFFGTTNDSEFLRDVTGNRRFYPVEINLSRAAKSVARELDTERDQIWAEAVQLFKDGNPTEKLSPEAEALAETAREMRIIDNPKKGAVMQFIQRSVAPDWTERTIISRRDYTTMTNGEGIGVDRDMVCAAEVWCECFGRPLSQMRQSDTREINTILDGLPCLRKQSARFIGPDYGKQRCYKYTREDE